MSVRIKGRSIMSFARPSQALALAMFAAAPSGLHAAPPPVAAVPPPPDQSVVDCAAQVYAIDAEICGDQALREENSRMQEQLRGYDWSQPSQSVFIETQQDWFRRRALCAFKSDRVACVRDAYLERNAVIAAIRQDRPDGAVAAQCSPFNWYRKGRPLKLLSLPGRIVLFDDTDTVRAVAVPTPGSSWRPFVAVERRAASRLQLRGPGGLIHCTITASPKPRSPKP